MRRSGPASTLGTLPLITGKGKSSPPPPPSSFRCILSHFLLSFVFFLPLLWMNIYFPPRSLPPSLLSFLLYIHRLTATCFVSVLPKRRALDLRLRDLQSVYDLQYIYIPEILFQLLSYTPHGQYAATSSWHNDGPYHFNSPFAKSSQNAGQVNLHRTHRSPILRALQRIRLGRPTRRCSSGPRRSRRWSTALIIERIHRQSGIGQFESAAATMEEESGWFV